MKKKILLIGENSFIGRHLEITLKTDYLVEKISYRDIDLVDTNYDVVINCALDPDLRSSPYNPNKDIDIKVARRFTGHFIMFSSRKVYGTYEHLHTFTENSQLNPCDHYSANKVITESKIAEQTDNHTILRASNVFGYEYNRKSFMGYMMDRLKDSGTIEIDISPYTIKDFISVDDLAVITKAVVDKQLKGVYNLGSGIGELTGNIAKYLIKGYGSGDLLCKSKQLKDQFILDNTKLLQHLQIENYQFNIEKAIVDLGKQLCKI